MAPIACKAIQNISMWYWADDDGNVDKRSLGVRVEDASLGL